MPRLSPAQRQRRAVGLNGRLNRWFLLVPFVLIVLLGVFLTHSCAEITRSNSTELLQFLSLFGVVLYFILPITAFVVFNPIHARWALLRNAKARRSLSNRCFACRYPLPFGRPFTPRTCAECGRAAMDHQEWLAFRRSRFPTSQQLRQLSRSPSSAAISFLTRRETLDCIWLGRSSLAIWYAYPIGFILYPFPIFLAILRIEKPSAILIAYSIALPMSFLLGYLRARKRFACHRFLTAPQAPGPSP